MDPRPKTLLLDIDGTLVLHAGTLADIWGHAAKPSGWQLLPGTVGKLQEWDQKGYRLILLTGRRECMRRETEAQLRELGIIYDHLIMDLGGGVRVLVNDRKPSGQETAIAINLERDRGIGELEL